MPTIAPETWAAWTGGAWSRVPAAPITGVSCDSRHLRPGELFVALRTERRDGHDFLPAAAAAGAAAALVAAPRHGVALPQLVVADPLRALQEASRRQRASFGGPVVGVTGSVGKTSTKDLLRLLLGGAPAVHATSGNLNNQIGVPLTLLGLDPAVHRAAVVEAGLSRPGDIEELGPWIAADHAIVTRICPAHLDGMGTLENIAREKAALLRHARPGGWAVMPAEAAAWPSLAAGHALRPLVLVSPGEQAPAGAEAVGFRVAAEGGATRIVLSVTGGAVRSYLAPALSPGLARNAGLALALAGRLGVEDGALQERLSRWSPAALRGQILSVPGGLLYLDCYNASPASVADALEHFAAVAPAAMARLYVLGSMGELGAESARLHREAGAGVPLRPGDRLVAVGDRAADLASGALAARPGAAVETAADAAAVSALLRGFSGAVLLKGSRRWALEQALDGTPFAPVAAAEGERGLPC